MRLIFKKDYDFPSPLENQSDKGDFQEWELVKNPQGEAYAMLASASFAFPLVRSSTTNNYHLLIEPGFCCDFLVWRYGVKGLFRYCEARGVAYAKKEDLYPILTDLIAQMNAHSQGNVYRWEVEDESGKTIDSGEGYLIYNIPSLLTLFADLREAVIRAAAQESEGKATSLSIPTEEILKTLLNNPLYPRLPASLLL